MRKEAGDRRQARTERSELLRGVEIIAPADSSPINFIARLLMSARQAAVGDGGEEGHHLLQRIGQIGRRLPEVLVEPVVALLPRAGKPRPNLLAKMLANERMGIEDGSR